MNIAFFSGKRGKIIAAMGVLVILLLLYFSFSLWRKDKAPDYITYTVVTGSLDKTVTSLGNLQPKDYVDVGAQVSGQLKKVHVEVGDTVERGQLLAEIDPTVYSSKVDADRANLKNLQAQLLSNQAALKLSSQELSRTRALYSVGAASQQALDTASATYSKAKAAVDSMKAQIESAESALRGDLANLGYTKIYAPMSGTVVSQTVLQGQTINSSQSAPTLLRVANLNVMTLNAQVAEADVPLVKDNMPVYFTTLGQNERHWKSTVRQVMPTPTVTNDVVLYTVLVDVDNADRQLMTQMTAQVFFMLGQARDLPTVPLSALKKIGEDDKTYEVSVITDGKIEPRKVTVALTNRSQAAISSGLKAGETIIVGKAGVAKGTGTQRQNNQARG